MTVKTTGGKKLQDLISNIKSKKPVSLSVGFYPTATYPNGINVASVAYWNEFGINTVERPFFRHGNNLSREEIRKIIYYNNDGTKPVLLSNNTLDSIGLMWKNNIQKSILGYEITYTPNTRDTIAAKGSSKPLIDTSVMLHSVNYKREVKL